MSTFKANTITNTTDDGAPNFNQGLKLNGVDITTLVNMTEFYSQSTEPTSPANGAVWWDGTDLYQYVADIWRIISISIPFIFQGTVSGYTTGGAQISGPPFGNATIDKFPFASDTNATDVGDLTQGRSGPAGQSSQENGYTSGGDLLSPPPSFSNTIDKFPFAADANATDVGDLFQGRRDPTGQSSDVSGYTSGGRPASAPSFANTVDKFPFASDTNATDVGDLTQGRYQAAGQSSTVSGYTSGGFAPPRVNTIDKFSFASDGNATDVGDLTQTRLGPTGQSSSENGYSSGGSAPPNVNTIDKFPFATDANATDVGDLTQSRSYPAGQSSEDNGYTSGGSPSTTNTTIDKFSFAADANATDVGDLTQGRNKIAGQQV